jgi:hypothetical protein
VDTILLFSTIAIKFEILKSWYGLIYVGLSVIGALRLNETFSSFHEFTLRMLCDPLLMFSFVAVFFLNTVKRNNKIYCCFYLVESYLNYLLIFLIHLMMADWRSAWSSDSSSASAPKII